MYPSGPSHPPPYPPRPPHPAWPSQPPAGPVAYRDPMQVFRTPPHVYARGKQLVFWSRMLVLASFLVGFAGCGGLFAVPSHAGPIFGIGLLLAAVIIIAAAVVGTIGRRMQGRIV